MSTIQEYLKQVRAAGGTPTFTNIGGQNPMLQPGPGRPMGGTQIPGAYLIKEQNQPMMGAGGMVSRPQPQRAIPTQGQAADPMQSRDPWAMANHSIKALMPEVWKQVFPNKQPGAELTESEMAVWQKAVKSVRNGLVDRYKYQVDQTRKDQEISIKEKTAQKPDEITMRDKARMFLEIGKEYDKESRQLMPGQEMPMSRDEYIMERMGSLEKYLGQGAIPDTPPQEQQQPYSAGPTGQMPIMNVPTADGFAQEVRMLAEKYGRTPEGKRRAIEELRRKYPSLNLPQM